MQKKLETYHFPNWLMIALFASVSMISCHADPKKSDIEITGNMPQDKSNTTPAISEEVLHQQQITSVLEILSLDPLAPEQWHLYSNGQSTFSQRGSSEGADLKMVKAINTSTNGKGIRIAISDTGLDVNHEDLFENILESECRNYDLNGPSYLGDPTPSTGSATEAHGTMVAGIIAAVEQNKIGIRGIAPKAQIAGFKYLGTELSKDKVIDQTAGDFDIFNYSYGALQCSISSVTRDQIDALKWGTENLRNGKGAIYIKAAGNEWSGILSNCNSTIIDADKKYYYGNTNFEALNTLPYLIVVGALGSNGKTASYSTPGANLWVVAPGGEDGIKNPAILTTDLSGCKMGVATSRAPEGRFDSNPELNHNCNYTSRMRGSSAATPMVSGAVALILSVNPELSWREVKYILAKSSDKPLSPSAVSHHPRSNRMPEGFIYQEGWTTNKAGHSFHNWYGFGSVNIDRAIEMATNYDSKNSAFKDQLRSTTINTTHESVYKSIVKKPIADFTNMGVEDSQTVLHDLIIESVQLEISVDHESSQDLAIELYSPSGTKSIVVNPSNGITDRNFVSELFGTNAFYGEKALGTWKIRVIDAEKNQIEGSLIEWGLRIYGHVGHQQSLSLTPVSNLSIKSMPTESKILESPLFSWQAEEEKEFLRYEVSIKDSKNNIVLPWTSVGKQKETKISQKTHRVRFFNNQRYQFQVRKIGLGEQHSKEMSYEWAVE